MNDEPDTNRLEAFSDGVFVIAITLLILEVKVPEGSGSLAHRLGEAWPSYARFLVSFAVIGTMWLNHHKMFQLISRTDHGVVVANLLLLLVVSIIPFPTKLIRLLKEGLPAREKLTQTRRNLMGFPLFAAATIIAIWSPVASLIVFGVLTAGYLMPSGPLDRLLVRGDRSERPS